MSIASTRALAVQFTVALADLLAGLVAESDALAAIDPARLTEGLVAAILRLGFLLHAEDRGLLAGSPVRDVADRLRATTVAELAERSGAWAEIQAIFRRIARGAASPSGGALLDPDAYPFLDAPVADAATRRVLDGLCFVAGERIAYRALPIEGLGGMYEALLGVAVVPTAGLTVALRPDHALVDLDALLAYPPEDRAARIEALSAYRLPPRRRRAVVAATSNTDLVLALAGRLSPRTPAPICAGKLVLAPATSRRLSGSHYTPPALTAEVIAAALAPHLDEPSDLAAILGLTLCDPAMGSGAFLLEAARFLGDRVLVALDLDPAALSGSDVAEARLAVASRCLHGVDKDPAAVELARISLWMLSGAPGKVRDFLGAQLQCGDSLLGARREDLAAYPHGVSRRAAPRRGKASDASFRRSKASNASFRRGKASDASFTLADFDQAPRDAGLRALDAWTALWIWPEEHVAERPRAKAFFAYLAAAAAGDVTAPDVARALSIARAARFVHWPAAFPAVFARGGFDAVVGNPPWVAYAGRAAQSLPPQVHRYYRKRSPAFFGYRTLHGLFLHLGATLLRPGGRLGLILPTSVSDLGGYQPARRAHDDLALIDADLPDFGAKAFEGVFQPAMALLSTRRKVPPTEAASGAPWRLAHGDLDRDAARLIERLSALPPLPPSLFGERGYQTMSDDAARLGDAPTSDAAVPLREGRDVGAFLARPPRVFLDPRGIEDRLRSAQSFGEVKLLIRQTARFPIAAIGDGLPFRNSILAGFASASHSPHFLVGYLNAAPVRFLHHARFRDARQGMPQVKIAHLRAIPEPPHAAVARSRLEAMGRALSSANRGIDEREVALLDALVAESLGLSDDELALVRAWARENPMPRSVYD